MSSFSSLQGATEAGPGDDRRMIKATAHHTLIVSVDGEPSSCVVLLEGSHDGDNWTSIATLQSPTGGVIGTQPTGHLMTWIRAYLEELVGSDVAVTATIASADD